MTVPTAETLCRARHGTRILRRALLTFDPDPIRTPADFSRAAVGVVWLARFYYVFAAHSIFVYNNFERAVSPGAPTDPLWPVVALTRLVGEGWLGHVIPVTLGGMAVALLAMIYPGARLWRLLVLLYMFLVTAVGNSYGSINHGYHFYLFIGFALLFLPPGITTSRSMSRRDVMCCVQVLWFAQSIMLLFYTMSGWWKIRNSSLALFEPDGFVRIMLARLMEGTAPVPSLLPLAASQGYLTQLMLLVTVYVQAFAIFAVFRPHLHRPFGIVLVLFHLGSKLLIGFITHHNILLLALFLILSPMAPTRFSLSGMLQSLPLFGILFRWRSARKRRFLPI